MDSKQFRRELRQNATPAEQSLWNVLRNRNFHGVKFRRQHSIGKYTVDFYCEQHQLIVELDGEGHFNYGSQYYDEERDNYLSGLGYSILRIENKRMFVDFDNVLRELEGALNIEPSP